MAFFETPRFPDRIAFGAQGGPGFSTAVIAVVSGAESRISEWSYPLHAWDLSQAVQKQADFEVLRAHFMSVRGRLHGFRFKDWTDYACSYSEGRVSGLTTTTFQLLKRYTSGAQTLDRKIIKPIASGFGLKDGATLLTLTTDYTLDATTGIVTTVVPRTAANLTWAGEFDVPMRYDTDQLRGTIVNKNPTDGFLHTWEAIPIVELRAP